MFNELTGSGDIILKAAEIQNDTLKYRIKIL